MNNARYIELFDSAINSYMAKNKVHVLDGTNSRHPVGLCIESKATYHHSVAYPSDLTVGVRVGHLGSSSVRWECAVFDTDGTLAAEGYFVHVFVESPEDKTKVKIEGRLREVLSALVYQNNP
ncbi:hypothetical protein TeGR_g1077 [Tetraparma gracilis]|uniref:Thioesterase n=1 Tax=Tetraparma gracilis TaxID=2962635 RepID=A0ABQ6MM17_9STRA|nr:hypothetical protein TeGR_g1077 [Tetraparma gracilis]